MSKFFNKITDKVANSLDELTDSHIDILPRSIRPRLQTTTPAPAPHPNLPIRELVDIRYLPDWVKEQAQRAHEAVRGDNLISRKDFISRQIQASKKPVPSKPQPQPQISRKPVPHPTALAGARAAAGALSKVAPTNASSVPGPSATANPDPAPVHHIVETNRNTTFTHLVQEYKALVEQGPESPPRSPTEAKLPQTPISLPSQQQCRINKFHNFYHPDTLAALEGSTFHSTLANVNRRSSITHISSESLDVLPASSPPRSIPSPTSSDGLLTPGSSPTESFHQRPASLLYASDLDPRPPLTVDTYIRNSHVSTYMARVCNAGTNLQSWSVRQDLSPGTDEAGRLMEKLDLERRTGRNLKY